MTKTIESMAIILLLMAAVILMGWYGVKPTEGSAIVGNDYRATTTVPIISGTFASPLTIKPGPGSFGSIIITGANTGVLQFVDATTSNVNLRTGQKATSTITIAEISSNLAAGTYVFDYEFTNGLLVTNLGGTAPTSTITYR